MCRVIDLSDVGTLSSEFAAEFDDRLNEWRGKNKHKDPYDYVKSKTEFINKLVDELNEKYNENCDKI